LWGERGAWDERGACKGVRGQSGSHLKVDIPTDLILCCSSRCTPEQVVHTKVLKLRTTYWLPRLSQSKQPRFSGFRWLSLRILLYLRRLRLRVGTGVGAGVVVWCLMVVLRSGGGQVEMGEGMLSKAGLHLGLVVGDVAGAEVGLGGGLWARHTSPRASCSTSWALTRADLGRARSASGVA